MIGFNLEKIIQSGGLLVIGGIVFAESGLLIGFFLPGDTLLFTAGVFAAQGKLPLVWLITTIVGAAIVGDNVGYSIGRRTGHRIFKKKDGIFFRHEHIARAEKFYEMHGGKTVVLARFLPFIRTFAPIVAGVGKMPRGRFMFFNVFGALFWGISVTLLGYWFGVQIPSIDRYILPAVAAGSLLTFGPALYHLLKDEKIRTAIFQNIRLFLRNIFLNKRID